MRLTSAYYRFKIGDRVKIIDEYCVLQNNGCVRYVNKECTILKYNHSNSWIVEFDSSLSNATFHQDYFELLEIPIII